MYHPALFLGIIGQIMHVICVSEKVHNFEICFLQVQVKVLKIEKNGNVRRMHQSELLGSFMNIARFMTL